MKVTETITRECCHPKDLRPVEGADMIGREPQFKFCVHCGRYHRLTHVRDPAGGTDTEYKRLVLQNMLHALGHVE
jgi:hypothetical protein